MSTRALPPIRRLRRGALPLGALLLGALSSLGCGLEFKGQATELRLSEASRDILKDDEAASAQLTAQLERLFGTLEEPGFSAPERARSASLGVGPAPEPGAPSLAGAAQLYARKCLHCHGNEGGGDGVTAHSLRPVPRDFRRGIFKFHALIDEMRPGLTQLERVITDGVEGTAMPSFEDLGPEAIAGLAEYTRLLAMRGEVESLLATEYAPGVPLSEEAADHDFEVVHALWFERTRRELRVPPVPPASPESIERGFELFHDASGPNCAGCHGPGGQSPGPLVLGPSEEHPGELEPLLHDVWGRPAIPRDLRQDRYLFGKQPERLYERIYLGINGTPMAGIGESLGPDGARLYAERELWALVHYVAALSDPAWLELREELDGRLP